MEPQTDFQANAEAKEITTLQKETSPPRCGAKRPRHMHPIVLVMILVVLGSALVLITWLTGIGNRFGNSLKRNDMNSSDSSMNTREVALSTAPSLTLTVTPTPSPTLLKQGSETYTISQGQSGVPTISKVTINPHDPEKGATQHVQIVTGNTMPIISISATLLQDNSVNTYQLQRVDGVSTNGVWEGSWEIRDTQKYTYVLTLRLKGEYSESVIDISMR